VNRRIVFDTSTLVGAALRIGSVPHRALLAAFRAWSPCTSPETLSELDRVLQREKFDRYAPRNRRREFVALIRRRAYLFPVPPEQLQSVAPRCRDPLDDKFLALAIAAEAAAIVSSDDDLLVLHPWCGLPVLTPAEFLRQNRA
jgi:uncharacterized protein